MKHTFRVDFQCRVEVIHERLFVSVKVEPRSSSRSSSALLILPVFYLRDWILHALTWVAKNASVETNLKATFTRRWTNFRPAEKFDRIRRSHGNVHYFCSVYTEFRTTRRLNFRTDETTKRKNLHPVENLSSVT